MKDAQYLQTVKSRIDGKELGYCQSHEHLFISDGQSSMLVHSLRLDDFEKTESELMTYKNLGGESLVDAQPVGCGRMADMLLRASISTGINILASTGFHKLIFYPENHWMHAMDQDALTSLYKSELESGMFIDCDNTMPVKRIEAKAGIIKTASDLAGPVGEYRKLFDAAGEASRLTGTTILSHTEMGKGALEQIKVFTSHGVFLDNIIICHLDRVLDDSGYLMEVASTGVYMEFDTIGRFKYHSDEDEVSFILSLVEKGYEDKILIGLDTTKERMKSYGGTLGLDYILTSFIPLLKSYGITENIIRKFTISNPAKAFTIKNQQI